MSSTVHPSLFKATALAAALIVGASAPAEAVVRASCSEQGRLIYREDLSVDTPEKRALISAGNPDAMCVFMEVPEAAASGMGNPYLGGEGLLPDSVIAAAAGEASPDGDSDLAAALAAIAGTRTGTRYGTERSAPPARSGAVRSSAPRPKARPVPQGQNMLSVALAVYKDVPLPSVMAHWRETSKGTRLLSRMTPTVTSADGVTMLSIDNVTDEDVAPLCDEAARSGLGCLAAY